MAKSLTKPSDEKPKLFALEWVLNNFDASAAYKKVISPGAKNPRSCASKYLNRVDVQRHIKEILTEKLADYDGGIDALLKELHHMAYFKMGRFVTVSGVNPNTLPGKGGPLPKAATLEEHITNVRDRLAAMKGAKFELDYEGLLTDEAALAALEFEFATVSDGEGGTVPIFKVKQTNKLAAIKALIEYHMASKGMLTPDQQKRPIIFNVNFEPPGTHWRNKSQPEDITDADYSTG